MRGTSTLYFKSLNRQFTVMGVDKQLFFLFMGLSIPIALSARLTPLMDMIAGIVFLILLTIGILLTRADFQMLSIYRRHINYKKYYHAIPGIHAHYAIIKPSVPFYQGQRGWV